VGSNTNDKKYRQEQERDALIGMIQKSSSNCKSVLGNSDEDDDDDDDDDCQLAEASSSSSSVVVTSVGIDLGTSNSAISYIKNGNATIIEIDGKRTIPSAVAYLQDGSTLVGQAALDRRLKDPLNTFLSIKRGRYLIHLIA
jgi:hypothetical protein